MGSPANQLTSAYAFPLYSNTSLDTQLRIGNTGGVDADVDVYIGGVKQNATPYNILVGESIRLEYAGVEGGPMQVVTNTPGASILVTDRVILGMSTATGYDELMGYPSDQLRAEYLFPWYNNKAMQSKIAIGVP